ncbi:hypothetical protein SESBI_40292 [Sesbania bispinosa]|nr:hypothetical protein SESBI_40292 [Sesbania bispinosa]
MGSTKQKGSRQRGQALCIRTAEERRGCALAAFCGLKGAAHGGAGLVGAGREAPATVAGWELTAMDRGTKRGNGRRGREQWLTAVDGGRLGRD